MVAFIPLNARPADVIFNIHKTFNQVYHISTNILGEEGSFLEIIFEDSNDNKIKLLEYFSKIPRSDIKEKKNNIITNKID
jgi:hypothetical protein